jgi:hypothetical protein
MTGLCDDAAPRHWLGRTWLVLCTGLILSGCANTSIVKPQTQPANNEATPIVDGTRPAAVAYATCVRERLAETEGLVRAAQAKCIQELNDYEFSVFLRSQSKPDPLRSAKRSRDALETQIRERF